jgi:hypothetical protein
VVQSGKSVEGTGLIVVFVVAIVVVVVVDVGLLFEVPLTLIVVGLVRVFLVVVGRFALTVVLVGGLCVTFVVFIVVDLAVVVVGLRVVLCSGFDVVRVLVICSLNFQLLVRAKVDEAVAVVGELVGISILILFCNACVGNIQFWFQMIGFGVVTNT